LIVASEDVLDQPAPDSSDTDMRGSSGPQLGGDMEIAEQVPGSGSGGEAAQREFSRACVVRSRDAGR